MTELDEVPEDAQLARVPDLNGNTRMIVETADGDVYDVGREPKIYTEIVGYDFFDGEWP